MHCDKFNCLSKSLGWSRTRGIQHCISSIKTDVKVIISRIFILLSFAAPMVIIGNCRCVFGPRFSFSFNLYSQHWQRPEKTVCRLTLGELKSESVALKTLLKV